MSEDGAHCVWHVGDEWLLEDVVAHVCLYMADGSYSYFQIMVEIIIE